MTEESTHPRQRSSDCFAEDDEWLADFLDWLDSKASRRSGSDSAQELVEHFLAEGPHSVSDRTRAMLLEFAGENASAGELAATAVLDWIENERDPTSENLPRDFGDYRLLEIIGRGGMGIVYRATQESLGRPVCIKLAPAGMDERSGLIREARVAGELHHPNIVSVFDAGCHAGRSFIAMELVDGQPLSAILANGPLGAVEAATMLRVICDAIGFAHQRQILHRDLKPSNVIVDTDHRPRVTDFGLAKRLRPPSGTGTDNANETLTGIAGTPSYMAPEQVQGDRLSERTDVYGLGTILYEMLSGRPPLVGHTPLETMRLVESTPPVDLCRLQVGLSKDLETICHKCLEKRPGNRYASIAELQEDLTRFLDGRPVQARPVSRVVRSARWAKRNRSVSVAVGVVTLSLLATTAGLGWMLSQTRSALHRTTIAETSQRTLAGELRQAVNASNEALYRSLIVQAGQALASNEVASARRSLSEIESGPSLQPLARMEYDILHRQAWPAETTIVCDSQPVAFRWNHSGDTLVTMDETGLLETWTSDGARRSSAVVPGFVKAPTPHLILHPTRDQAVIIAGNELYRFNDFGKLEPRPASGFTERCTQVVWHPNQEFLVGLSAEGSLVLHELATGVSKDLRLVANTPRQLSISPDGQFLALLIDNQVRVWKWERIRNFTVQGFAAPKADAVMTMQAWPTDVVWLPTATSLAVLSENGRVETYQVVKSKNDAIRFRLSWVVQCDVLAPSGLQVADGQICVVGQDELVEIDTQDHGVRQRQPLPVWDEVRMNSGGSTIALSESDSREISLWDLSKLGRPRSLATTAIPVRKVAFGNRGQLLAWRDVDGKTVASRSTWRPASVELVETAQPATGLDANPVVDQLAVSRGNSVVVYGMPRLTECFRVSRHESPVVSVSYSGDGRYLATGDFDGRVVLSEGMSGAEVTRLEGMKGDIRDVVFSSDNQSLLVADADGQIQICDLRSGAAKMLQPINTASINALAFLPAGDMVVGDSAGDLHLRNRKGTASQAWKSAHRGPIWSLVTVRDRVVSAGQDGAVRVWDRNGNLLATLVDLQDPIWSIDYSSETDQLIGSTTAGRVFTLAW
ncbi:protein kinase [Roseiconus nitratireducens]|uniref:Protein kinase n=1 Tax=Roseiconus nitratireducens TaxID=2605748 RepID=A0A5M6CSI3_9BACT|nr:serine/threonine-protein kinase [Roseiconus nitratireducens]KAA5537963.1 protein kinase [Roseiconus nitratireducens]